MDRDVTEHTAKWLSLQQASELLGVHPATLRQWADQGRVRVFRTPGGHRRFAEEDLRSLIAKPALTPQRAAGVQVLVQSALGRARLEVTGGRLVNEPWYRQFDEANKARHRELGRQLMNLLMRYLMLNGEDEEDRRVDILKQARRIGDSYGVLAYREGLTLADAMRAFLFFRDFLQESVIQGQQIAGDPLALVRQINRYVNEVLLAMVHAFEHGAERGEPGTET